MKKQYVFNEPATETFNKVGISGKIFPSSRTPSESGFVLIETSKGHETSIIEHKCNFVYYVLEGNGHFFVEDKKHDCKTGDLITIPPGTKFTYRGKLKMLLVTTPPFYPEQEETVIE